VRRPEKIEDSGRGSQKNQDQNLGVLRRLSLYFRGFIRWKRVPWYGWGICWRGPVQERDRGEKRKWEKQCTRVGGIEEKRDEKP